MEKIQVKERMIQLSNYVTVRKEDSLIEVFEALEQARKSENERAHRDAIVVDANGVFVGKLTMSDIFLALEPNYKKIEKKTEKGHSDFRVYHENSQRF